MTRYEIALKKEPPKLIGEGVTIKADGPQTWQVVSEQSPTGLYDPITGQVLSAPSGFVLDRSGTLAHVNDQGYLTYAHGVPGNVRGEIKLQMQSTRGNDQGVFYEAWQKAVRGVEVRQLFESLGFTNLALVGGGVHGFRNGFRYEGLALSSTSYNNDPEDPYRVTQEVELTFSRRLPI